MDGPEARAWIAEHDLIDHAMLEKALAGLGGGVRPGPEPRAPAGPGCGSPSTRPPTRGRTRGVPGPGARAQRRLPLQGLVQDRARLGVPVHRGSRPPAHRLGLAGRRGAHRARHPDGATIAQVKTVPCAACGPPGTGRGPRRCRLRRRLQRRRPHRRASRLPGRRPGPARRRVGVLRAARHLGRKGRPPAAPRCRGALPGARGLRRRRRRQRAPGPEEAAAPQPRAGRGRTRPCPVPRSTAPSGPGRRMTGAPPHPRRPRLVPPAGRTSRSCPAP